MLGLRHGALQSGKIKRIRPPVRTQDTVDVLCFREIRAYIQVVALLCGQMSAHTPLIHTGEVFIIAVDVDIVRACPAPVNELGAYPQLLKEVITHARDLSYHIEEPSAAVGQARVPSQFGVSQTAYAGYLPGSMEPDPARSALWSAERVVGNPSAYVSPSHMIDQLQAALYLLSRGHALDTYSACVLNHTGGRRASPSGGL